MNYRCIPCDHVFEVVEGAKPRCPKCMGIHDVEPVSEATAGEAKGGRKWLAPVVVLLVAGLIGVIYVTVGDGGDAGDETGDAATLADTLSEIGILKRDGMNPMPISDEIEEFAEEAAGGKGGVEGLEGIFDAIGKLKGAGRWKPHHQREPRRGEPLPADRLLARLREDGREPYEAFSYELSALMLAAARSQDIDAQMVEIFKFDGENKPADPGGKLGCFGVVAGKAGGDPPPPLFDPFSGRSGASAKAEFTGLTEQETLAPFFGLKAMSLLAERETNQALKLNEAAIKLAPTNPYFYTGRGLIFAASGAPHEALAEFEKASKQRGDAVSRVNLAEILLLADPTGRKAEAELQAALAKLPDYARAHGLLGMVHLMRREEDQAEQELVEAQRLDPASPIIAMFWAQFHVAKANSEEAISRAQEAVRLSGDSVSTLLGLAGIYRATARFDEMRSVLDKVITQVDSPGVAREIKEIFGYDPQAVAATDEPAEGTVPGGEGDAGSGSLKLELPSKESPFGGKLKLGEGLGSGLGGGGGPGLGGGGLKLDLDLKK